MSSGMVDVIKAHVGKTATIRLGGGILVDVIVTDVKERWGRLRYFVTPVSGSGEMWTETITLKQQ